MEIIEKAPAKINLALDTPYKHKDGEPEWNMVMTSIDIADYVRIVDNNSGKITVQSDSLFLPEDHRNLAYQAADLIKNKFNIHLGVEITIRKNIPVSAGLGGGSSDAAAVLRGLNKIWNLKMSLEDLANLSLELDSDVPYCIFSKTAKVSGRGANINPLHKLPSMYFVIVKPQVSISTPQIIRKINYKSIEHKNVNNLVQSIYQNNYTEIVNNMFNVLEPISAEKHHEIYKIKMKMLNYGADSAQMSGTGPTVFGVCKTEQSAKHVFNSIRGFCSEVYLVHSL
ncbi:4-(cytidine 5'-diphospho)-2-C-methyl-D-erythritol kinase [Apilactobacillus sp. TMW 2.2459]|uniref:4-(cytidine 5'-diphospho)-2-C-methyl-D-erythritol kinase n=1 Tax=Apilactobacillus xinyiensis TaxID=2841032 RepID=UPI002010392C|nr:4-(cytidine 5'-diphospho)-2-C-methyl-D-erythritol kinase [Apilactobacillus xinyiensis]MCL0312858.1 4-(cytidine 5'-diphospho)-2-C-methyl-D-erythritol kinase [Apilactobacillus xinyiensis]